MSKFSFSEELTTHSEKRKISLGEPFFFFFFLEPTIFRLYFFGNDSFSG